MKRWHWLKDSPMRQVDKPSEDNARTRFLSKDELQRLLAACRESKSPDLYLAVLLAITTGARQGELLGLRWRDMDLDRGLLHLRVDNETTTKGGVRSLPIAAQLLPLFKDRLAELALDTSKEEARIPSSLVFPGRVSANTPIYLRRSFENALKRAGIEDFRWHDLRHSAASFFAANGASLLEIGAVLGHKTAQTTKRYAHLTEQATHALVRGTADKLLGGDP
jgi:integrase